MKNNKAALAVVAVLAIFLLANCSSENEISSASTTEIEAPVRSTIPAPKANILETELVQIARSYEPKLASMSDADIIANALFACVALESGYTFEDLESYFQAEIGFDQGVAIAGAGLAFYCPEYM